jgi:hypothetical protein
METKSPISDQTSASTESDPGRGVKRPYRIFSFPGAGFDTVMQMGVVHAMLVTRRRAPEMVAGISVGAITATALGEVLRATGGSEGSSNVFIAGEGGRFVKPIRTICARMGVANGVSHPTACSLPTCLTKKKTIL